MAFLTIRRRNRKEKTIQVDRIKPLCHFPPSLLLHGPCENRPDVRTRRLYCRLVEGMVSDTSDTLLDRIVLIEQGRKIEGQSFPLLFGYSGLLLPIYQPLVAML